MSHLEIFGLYLALNLILFVWLTGRVIVVRRSHKISLGDNEDNNLRKRIRSQANFAETAPLALIGLLTLAFFQIPVWCLHLFGGALTLGRICHAHGMLQRGAIGAGRPLGMVMTLLVILAEAFYILYLVLT